MSGEGRIIRDKIEIGVMRPYVRATNLDERVRMLKAKLIEEAGEAALAQTEEQLVEELADVVQVAMDLDLLLGRRNPDLKDMMHVLLDKKERSGGFEKGKALSWEPWIDYARRQEAADELTRMTEELGQPDVEQ